MDLDLGLSGQIVTDGASTLTNLDFSGLDVDLTGGKMLRLAITVDDPFELGNSIFYLGVGGFSNWIQWRFGVQTGTTVASFKPGEQTVITLLLSEIQAVNGTITLSADGIPSVLSGFTHARLQVDDDGNAPVTVDLHSVEVVQPSLPGAYCSITFDDGHDSVTDLAYPKMAALGFRGTEYVIVEAVDTADHVTSADLAARHAAGWEIGGHSFASSVHTASLINVNAAAAAADMASNVAWLQANFPDPDGRYTMAYPKGEFFDTTDAVAIEPLVKAAGYLAGRSAMCNPGSTTSLQIESLPPPIMTRLYGAGGISDVSAGQQNPANLIGAGGMLDKLESNGGWLILAFHVITEGAAATSIQCSQADFDAIMDDLAARDITVAPVRDVLAQAANPAAYAKAVERGENTDEIEFTNTAYSAGSTPCGVPFVAPPSGRVAVHIYCFFDSNTGDPMFVSSAVHTGSGTPVLNATDTRSLTTRNRESSGMARFVGGLVPGAIYNAQVEFRAAAGSGDIFNRSIMVVPLP